MRPHPAIHALNSKNISSRAIAAFLTICFGLTWSLALGGLYAGARLDAPTGSGTALAGVCMLMPALSSWVVRRYVTHEGFADAGLRRGPLRVYLWVWLLVPALQLLALALSLSLNLARFDLAQLAARRGWDTQHISVSALLALSLASAASVNLVFTTLWALVAPASVVGQMNMRRFTETYAALGVTVRVFTDPRPAEEWLAGV